MMIYIHTLHCSVICVRLSLFWSWQKALLSAKLKEKKNQDSRIGSRMKFYYFIMSEMLARAAYFSLVVHDTSLLPNQHVIQSRYL